MDFVPLVAAIALIYAIVNVIKQLQGGQTKEAVTQLLTWLVAVAIVLLLGASSFASTVQVGDWTLTSMNFAGQILFALSLASTSNVLYDVIPKSTPTLGASSDQAAGLGAQRLPGI